MKPLIKNSRQAKNVIISILVVVLSIHLSDGVAQNQKSKIDYNQKSNIMNPDTLRGDNLKIHKNFLEWSHKEVKEMESSKLKSEFEKIGITTNEKDRFLEAYFFLRIDLTGHKKSVEQWEHFKYLKPKD